jgi:hypothetical protein
VAVTSPPRFAVYDECPIHRITAPPDVHNVHPKPRQRQKRRRGGDRQKEAVLLQVGDRDEDDDRSRNDVHQRQGPDGRQRQEEYDGTHKTAGRLNGNHVPI